MSNFANTFFYTLVDCRGCCYADRTIFDGTYRFSFPLAAGEPVHLPYMQFAAVGARDRFTGAALGNLFRWKCMAAASQSGLA